MHSCFFFFFNDTATTEISTYGHTLSLHDALPISQGKTLILHSVAAGFTCARVCLNIGRPGPLPSYPTAPASYPVPVRQLRALPPASSRSEEHTSELQSLMRISYAVFCLKKKKHLI